MVVLITRPGEPGQTLAARLQRAGQAALWWPAFDLLPPTDPRPVRATLAQLAGFDLVVFVSPMAVQALADSMAASMPDLRWPVATRMAAVGGATLRAVGSLLQPGEGTTIIGPAGADAGEGGVEALWPAIAALRPAPRRVLIVRAQSGREWLGGKLRATGAQVEELAAYRRIAHAPTPHEWDGLHGAVGGEPPRALAVLFSSTEAVGALTPALVSARLGPQRAGAVALCVHERIAQAAAAAGWTDVRCCEPRADAVVAALGAGSALVADGAAAPASRSGGPRPDSVA